MTGTNRCGDCKFLGPEITESIWDHSQPPPRTPIREEGTGYFPCLGVPFVEDNAPTPLKAHVVDGSGYMGALRVPKDFGCVYWEKKDEQQKATHKEP